MALRVGGSWVLALAGLILVLVAPNAEAQVAVEVQGACQGISHQPGQIVTDEVTNEIEEPLSVAFFGMTLSPYEPGLYVSVAVRSPGGIATVGVGGADELGRAVADVPLYEFGMYQVVGVSVYYPSIDEWVPLSLEMVEFGEGFVVGEAESTCGLEDLPVSTFDETETTEGTTAPTEGTTAPTEGTTAPTEGTTPPTTVISTEPPPDTPTETAPTTTPEATESTTETTGSPTDTDRDPAGGRLGFSPFWVVIGVGLLLLLLGLRLWFAPVGTPPPKPDAWLEIPDNPYTSTSRSKRCPCAVGVEIEVLVEVKVLFLFKDVVDDKFLLGRRSKFTSEHETEKIIDVNFAKRSLGNWKRNRARITLKATVFLDRALSQRCCVAGEGAFEGIATITSGNVTDSSRVPPAGKPGSRPKLRFRLGSCRGALNCRTAFSPWRLTKSYSLPGVPTILIDGLVYAQVSTYKT